MAIFKGTCDELITYIGPKCRNEIQKITRNEKKKLNFICQHCNKKMKELDAAHVKGFERTDIIKKIYAKLANNNEIDLGDFMSEFLTSHYPLNDHFLYLCKTCHNKYDGK